MATTASELVERHPTVLESLRALARNFSWVHLGLGLFGNVTFVVGSVLFLWESTKLAGTVLFIVGSTGMLIGSVGRALVKDWSSDPAS